MNEPTVYARVKQAFRIGQRVSLHAATSEWMQGDRYGEGVGYGRKRDYLDTNTNEITSSIPVLVRLDKSGRTRRFHESLLYPID